MGLMNTSSQIQRIIDDRLSYVAETTTPFIDDILIGTTATEEEDILEKHDRDLRRTLDLMENDQFVTNPKKMPLLCEGSGVLWIHPRTGDQTPCPREVVGHRKMGVTQNSV